MLARTALGELDSPSMDARIRAIADYLLSRTRASDFDPRGVPPNLLRHMYILDVVRGSKADIRLRVRFAGTAIEHRFDRSIRGEFLDSYAPRGHGRDVLQGFARCVVERRPVWMRQVTKLDAVSAYYIEGVAHFLEPERVYGALVTGRILNTGLDNAMIESRTEVVPLGLKSA